MDSSKSSSDFAVCEQEIHDLHLFFQEWFRGALPQDEATFARLTRALADDFVIITPTGRTVEGPQLVDGLWAQHGSWKEQEGGRIWIEKVRPRRAIGDFFLLTYEEWQDLSDVTRGRLSTVLMRRFSEAPGGIEWLHLHEVWLPGPEAHAVPSTVASEA